MKKLVLLSVVVFSLVLMAGCGKKTTNVTTDTTTQVVNTAKTDATKDQCLQLVVYGMKVALAQTKGDTATATKLADEAMAMEKQLNLDNVEYETACGKYMTDAAFVKKVQDQVKELQQ